MATNRSCSRGYTVLVLVLVCAILHGFAKPPLHTKPPGAKNKGYYIVALKLGVNVDSFIDGFPGLKGLIRHRLSRVVNGFAGEIPPGILNKLLASDDVEYVEEDGKVIPSGTLWGLDRIDQRNLPLDRQFNVANVECYTQANGFDYAGLVSTTENGKTCQKWSSQSPHSHSRTPANYPNAGLGDHNHCRNPAGEPRPWCYTTDANVRWELCNVGNPQASCTGGKFGDGTGVHIYVFDTGIRATHNEFSGRMGNGFDAYGQNGHNTDCHGHGTHCAGTAAGKTYRVARGATIHSVKVMKCYTDANGQNQVGGSIADFVAGLDWVLKEYESGTKPAVASMSLGGAGSSPSETDAVNKLHDAGVVVVAASGNEYDNACGYSPAGIPKAITVGATDKTDKRGGFSNFGSCVDIHAPGVAIDSAGKASDTAVEYGWQGTSMACPHVAGAAAVMLGANKALTATQVTDKLIENSTKGKVTDVKGSPNRLLYIPGKK